MDSKKKRTIIISSIAALMFITPLAVLAALYFSQPKTNKFEPADINVQIEEKSTSEDMQTQEYTFPEGSFRRLQY